MTKVYNRQEAVRYAQQWALSPNPNYFFFGGLGGDCTNFTSQCLLAGGAVMNYNYVKGWYYSSSANRSPSWSGVEYFRNFILRQEETKGPVGKVVALSEAEEGDILLLRQNPTHFNHSLIISRKIGGQIYVCAHTNNALNRPLQEYFYHEILPIHIQHINID